MPAGTGSHPKLPGLYLGYDSDDRSLFRYAVANVAAEICSRSVCAEVVDMGGAAT